jgi:hypothetical protein
MFGVLHWLLLFQHRLVLHVAARLPPATIELPLTASPLRRISNGNWVLLGHIGVQVGNREGLYLSLQRSGLLLCFNPDKIAFLSG